MIDSIAAFFGIIGSILLARGSQHLIKYSFICYWIGSACWLIFGLHQEIYSLVIVNVVFILVESIGYLRWHRKDQRLKTAQEITRIWEEIDDEISETEEKR